MPHLIWSPEALQDVARLHEFLKAKNPTAALRAVHTIRQGVKLLAKYPEAGRSLDKIPQELREWPITFGRGGYIALYRYDREIIILHVRHAKEDGHSSL